VYLLSQSSLNPALWPIYCAPLALSTLAATVGCRRIRRQSPFSATVAKFGDYSRQCGQGLCSENTSPCRGVDSNRFLWGAREFGGK